MRGEPTGALISHTVYDYIAHSCRTILTRTTWCIDRELDFGTTIYSNSDVVDRGGITHRTIRVGSAGAGAIRTSRTIYTSAVNASVWGTYDRRAGRRVRAGNWGIRKGSRSDDRAALPRLIIMTIPCTLGLGGQSRCRHKNGDHTQNSEETLHRTFFLLGVLLCFGFTTRCTEVILHGSKKEVKTISVSQGEVES